MRTALWLYILPNLGILLLLMAASDISLERLYDPTTIAVVENIYQNGTFMEITFQRIYDWYESTGSNFLLQFLLVFPLFLFGAGFSKGKRLLPNEKNKRLWKTILVYSLPLGLLLKIFPYFGDWGLAGEYLQDVFGGPALTMAYISIVFLITYKRDHFPSFQLFANAGKMSLSNYLLQSVLCSLIFYGYGLGLFGK